MKTVFLSVIFTLLSTKLMAEAIKEVRVYKASRSLELIDENNKLVKSYKIMLGKNPTGAKTKEGDNKTPEGVYILDALKPNSDFHRALHISYPNRTDIIRAKIRGENPGGSIMVHGLPNNFLKMQEWLKSVNMDGLPEETIRENLVNFDWTDGCIAVTDKEIEEITGLVKVPTPILIYP